MTKILREEEAELSGLVEAAGRREEVLIVVRECAKSSPAHAATAPRAANRRAWLRELRALQRRYSRDIRGAATGRFLSLVRKDRA